MSVAKDFETPEDVIFPPGNLESNEPPLETYLHLQQMLLLIKCLDWWWRDLNRFNDYFAAGNISIHYSPRQRKSEDFRGPDFFVVLDTERKPRDSWVVWEEDGKYPNLISGSRTLVTSSHELGASYFYIFLSSYGYVY
ncbi:MAG: Uma2 family endonuclease, partial [Nostoc sp.]